MARTASGRFPRVFPVSRRLAPTSRNVSLPRRFGRVRKHLSAEKKSKLFNHFPRVTFDFENATSRITRVGVRKIVTTWSVFNRAAKCRIASPVVSSFVGTHSAGCAGRERVSRLAEKVKALRSFHIYAFWDIKKNIYIFVPTTLFEEEFGATNGRFSFRLQLWSSPGTLGNVFGRFHAKHSFRSNGRKWEFTRRRHDRTRKYQLRVLRRRRRRRQYVSETVLAASSRDNKTDVRTLSKFINTVLLRALST